MVEIVYMNNIYYFLHFGDAFWASIFFIFVVIPTVFVVLPSGFLYLVFRKSKVDGLRNYQKFINWLKKDTNEQKHVKN